jgi:hypothetical protein
MWPAAPFRIRYLRELRARSCGGDRKFQMAPRKTPVESLLTCRKCKLELRLFGIEAESAERDLYSFECTKCGSLEVRGVKVK